MSGLGDASRHLSTNHHDLGVDKECEQYPQPAPSQTSGGRRKLETMVDLVNTSSADITQIQRPGGVPNEVAPFHTDVQNVTLAPQNLSLLR